MKLKTGKMIFRQVRSVLFAQPNITNFSVYHVELTVITCRTSISLCPKTGISLLYFQRYHKSSLQSWVIDRLRGLWNRLDQPLKRSTNTVHLSCSIISQDFVINVVSAFKDVVILEEWTQKRYNCPLCTDNTTHIWHCRIWSSLKRKKITQSILVTCTGRGTWCKCYSSPWGHTANEHKIDRLIKVSPWFLSQVWKWHLKPQQ